MRPESLVASTSAGRKPELAFDPGGRRIKVNGRVDHMIDPHRLTKLPIALWMRPCAFVAAQREEQQPGLPLVVHCDSAAGVAGAVASASERRLVPSRAVCRQGVPWI
jgi:hypothetical protein